MDVGKLYDLIFKCPFQDEQPNCPFHDIRSLPILEGLDIINKTPFDERMDLYTKHKECLFYLEHRKK